MRPLKFFKYFSLRLRYYNCDVTLWVTTIPYKINETVTCVMYSRYIQIQYKQYELHKYVKNILYFAYFVFKKLKSWSSLRLLIFCTCTMFFMFSIFRKKKVLNKSRTNLYFSCPSRLLFNKNISTILKLKIVFNYNYFLFKWHKLFRDLCQL